MPTLSRRHAVIGTAALLAAPALIGRARAATTLKISTSYPNDPVFAAGRVWYDIFLPHLKAATGDQIAVQYFPDNQLGQEADIANQVKLGVVDMMLTGSSIWTNLVPEFGVFDMGYVFKDYDHMRRATATPAGAALQKMPLQKTGTHLPPGRNAGPRNFMTKIAVSKPEELAGKKIRLGDHPHAPRRVRQRPRVRRRRN